MPTKKDIFVIIAIICIILFGFMYYSFDKKNLVIETSSDFPELESKDLASENYDSAENINEIQKTIPEDDHDITILAYISGEVNNPDVYEIEQDSRIKDLVEKAGGFTDEADKDNINLSQSVKDEDHIHIYKIGEESSVIINPDDKTKSQQQTGLININTATIDELKELPNIGDVIANNIINYREQKGGFKIIDELKNVDRIGEKTFNKIKDLVCV